MDSDVRIGNVEDVVPLQSASGHVFLGEHVHQVLIVRQRQVCRAPLEHVDVAERLPEVGADAVQQRDARRSGRARGDDLFRDRELPSVACDSVVRAAQI